VRVRAATGGILPAPPALIRPASTLCKVAHLAADGPSYLGFQWNLEVFPRSQLQMILCMEDK